MTDIYTTIPEIAQIAQATLLTEAEDRETHSPLPVEFIDERLSSTEAKRKAALAAGADFALDYSDPEWRKAALAKADNPHRQVSTNIENLRRIHAAGVKIALGTDSGATPLRIPGFAEHLELGHMVAAGMTPVQALTVATRNGAELLGAPDRGCLWQGCRADLLILSADPTTDIAASRSIREVWRNGQPVPR